MPKFLQFIGWLSPLWHATEIGRWISYGHHISFLAITIHFAYMTIMLIVGLRFAHHHFKRRLSK
jgi:lipooligosaccharide transport system permease protein